MCVGVGVCVSFGFCLLFVFIFIMLLPLQAIFRKKYHFLYAGQLVMPVSFVEMIGMPIGHINRHHIMKSISHQMLSAGQGLKHFSSCIICWWSHVIRWDKFVLRGQN